MKQLPTYLFDDLALSHHSVYVWPASSSMRNSAAWREALKWVEWPVAEAVENFWERVYAATV